MSPLKSDDGPGCDVINHAEADMQAGMNCEDAVAGNTGPSGRAFGSPNEDAVLSRQSVQLLMACSIYSRGTAPVQPTCANLLLKFSQFLMG